MAKEKILPTMQQIEYEYLQTLAELEAFCIENETDEVPEEFLERLNINRDELEHKLYNYYLVVEKTKADQAILLGEAGRLNHKATKLQRKIDYLKYIMDRAVEKFGSDIMGKDKQPTGNLKIQSTFVNISRIGTRSVNVEDETALPDKYRLVDITFSNMTIAERDEVISLLDAAFAKLTQGDGTKANRTIAQKVSKSSIKEDMEAGKEVKGAKLQTNYHLRFS